MPGLPLIAIGAGSRQVTAKRKIGLVVSMVECGYRDFDFRAD
jgi:hypothetical protein